MSPKKGSQVPRIMVFRPTWEEFSNFSKYIEYMESKGAHLAGVVKVILTGGSVTVHSTCSAISSLSANELLWLASRHSLACSLSLIQCMLNSEFQVIPPPEYVPRKIGYDLDRLKITIPAPIEQIVSGKQGVYQQINVQKRPMTVKQFRDLALSERYQTPRHFDYEDLERYGFASMIAIDRFNSCSLIIIMPDSNDAQIKGNTGKTSHTYRRFTAPMLLARLPTTM